MRPGVFHWLIAIEITLDRPCFASNLQARPVASLQGGRFRAAGTGRHSFTWLLVCAAAATPMVQPLISSASEAQPSRPGAFIGESDE